MKSTETFVALAAAMLFVAMQHREKPWRARVRIAGTSGGIGYAVAPELAARFSFVGENTAMVLVTALIYAALDMVSSIIADRETIKAILTRKGGPR